MGEQIKAVVQVREGVTADDALRASIMEHLSGSAGQVQVAAHDRLRGRAAPRAHRQAAQAQAARPVLGRPPDRDLIAHRPPIGSRRREGNARDRTAHRASRPRVPGWLHALDRPRAVPLLRRACATGRSSACASSDGRVMVPPTEYDPMTAAALDDYVEVGPAGTVTAWTWVERAPARQAPPRQAVRVRAREARRRGHRDGARRRCTAGLDLGRHAGAAALAGRAGRVRHRPRRLGAAGRRGRARSRAREPG